MKWEESVRFFAERSGISESLSHQVQTLIHYLNQAVEDRGTTELQQQLGTLPELAYKSFDEEDKQAAKEIVSKLENLPTEKIARLLRLYTVYFHLVNSLEQREITRINRKRALESSPDNPRAESIGEAVFRLKEQGYSYEDALEVIRKLDIQPTITAHPTEARRHSILQKQQHITALISELEEDRFSPVERRSAIYEILNEINLLLATDEVRSERVTVEDEVENGMFYFTSSIWQTIPTLYHDLEHAFDIYYDKKPDLPVVLKYRSWIGSDRDGNPNVTPEVTWETLLDQRKNILTLYLEELERLRKMLSVSDNQYTISEALQNSIQSDEEQGWLPERYKRLYRHEPYRRKITYIMHKLQHQIDSLGKGTREAVITESEYYTADDFIAELELMAESLSETGMDRVARYGQLNDLIIRARTFGFCMAALDVRQHSRLHEEAVEELLSVSGVLDGYSGKSEQEKIEIITSELKNPRPLTPVHAELSERTAEMINTFKTIRSLIALDGDSFGSYIISMTHGISDMLEVLILAKETGLWSLKDGKVESFLDVVPLFETIEDLEACDEQMAKIYENELYANQLKARGDFQEIMLGYSDSNKDGGYWMANWALEKAQQKLGRVCRKYEMDFRLFHGRGGTVGRGGGRSNQAIMALPPISNNGRIRFTEQGEVISFRYSLPSITRRHLEQIVNAMIRVTEAEPSVSDEKRKTFADVMEKVAQRSMESYRSLIDDKKFWSWYTSITPIEHISRLPIASRPVSRKGPNAADFDNLRAIPWVFAWTQVRYNVPGWFGVGTALHGLMDEQPKLLETLRKWYREWIFFKTVLDNAQREMARTHLITANIYNRSNPSELHDRIVDDYKKAEEAIIKITGQQEILGNSEVIRKSILFRNPFTYPLNMMQVELLKRWNEKSKEDEEELRNALFISINGIAAAMQSTG